MASTDLVPFRQDLIHQNDIMNVIKSEELTSDLCEEDFEKEKARWAKGGTKGDLAVVQALEALQQGRTLIDLPAVLAKGGFNPKYTSSKMPSLTVAPAFAKEVSMRVWHDGEMVLKSGRFPQWKMNLPSGYTFSRSGDAVSYSGVATVPGMPPEIREIARKEHLVLWQAEWRKIGSQVQRPPRDPALLERLNGNMYVVLAAWDLTALEASALCGE